MRAAVQFGTGFTTLPPREVRARLRRATRSSYRHWLWPELPPGDWQDALGQIERAIRSVLGDGQAVVALNGSAAAMGIAGYTSGMGPLLGYWIEVGALRASREIEEGLEIQLAHNRVRMKLMETRARKVVEAIVSAGFEATALKGIHSAFTYFPEPGTRPISDIDILVRPSSRSAVAEILRGLGFETSEGHLVRQTWREVGRRQEPMTLKFLHQDDPWSVDLHLSLDRSYAPGTPMIELDVEAATMPPDGWALESRARVLANPVALLNLMVHAACPLLQLSLLRLVEIVMVIEKDQAAGRLNWDEFLAAAKKARALGLLHVVARQAEILIPGTFPKCVLAACEQAAPARVRCLVETLTPASAQGIRRSSIAERFMWSESVGAVYRQARAELWPRGVSLWRRLHIARLCASHVFRTCLAPLN